MQGFNRLMQRGALAVLVLAVLHAFASSAVHAQSMGATSVPSCQTKGWCNPPATQAVACEALNRRSTGVPRSAIDAALADPSRIGGWDQLMNPNIPESPTNTRRRSLTLADPGKRYDAMWNALVFKAGCQ